MTSYTIATPVIEHYADAVAQFERLLGRLTHIGGKAAGGTWRAASGR